MHAVSLLLLGASLAAAQQPQAIARAVASAPDGVVRMSYASRAGVCGDGDRYINFGEAFYSGSASGFGRMSGARCMEGPVRVTLTVEGGRPVRVRAAIGSWSSVGSERVTDIGVVPASEAAAYFLSVMPQLEKAGASRALLPAVLADSVDVVPELLRLARDRARTLETRRQAVHWSRMLGDERALAALRALVEDAGEAVELRSHAIFALSMEGGTAPVQQSYLVALLERLPERKLREQVVFALSRGDDPQATDALIRVARTDRDLEVRKKAWFWLGQMKDPRAERAIAEMVLR